MNNQNQSLSKSSVLNKQQGGKDQLQQLEHLKQEIINDKNKQRKQIMYSPIQNIDYHSSSEQPSFFRNQIKSNEQQSQHIKFADNDLKKGIFQKQTQKQRSQRQSILKRQQQQIPIIQTVQLIQLQKADQQFVFQNKDYNRSQSYNRQSILVEQQMTLKKDLVFSLIVVFCILHIYYTLTYRLQLFSIVNLFFILLWITISSHQLNKTQDESKLNIEKIDQTTEFKKYLIEFINYKKYHSTVNKVIFGIISFNFIVIDLLFFKIFVGKLLFFQSFINSSSLLTQFIHNFIDLRFVNTLQTIFKAAIQRLTQQFNSINPSTATQDQFILIKIFNFISQAFQKIYAILSILIKFLSEFFINVFLDGQFCIYLILVIICLIITFKNFFKVSKKVQNFIQNINNCKQQIKNQQIKNEKTQKSLVNIISNKKNQTIQPQSVVKLKKTQSKQNLEEKPFSGTRKKKRKTSIDSSFQSQNSQQNIRNPLQYTQDFPIYRQFSKYLLILSLIFMYVFCFFADQSQIFIFSPIKSKHMWGLLFCLYSFLIVQYCKNKYKNQIKINSDEIWFKIKIFLVTLLTILLIMNDFVASKLVCWEKIKTQQFLINFMCFEQQTKYFYYFTALFYNSHSDEERNFENSFKLSIALQYLMKLIILLNLRFHKFYLLRTKNNVINVVNVEKRQKSAKQKSPATQNNNLAQSSYTSTSLGGVSTQSFTLRRKLTKISQSLERNTIILIIFTILIMALSNSLSNIVILLGVFVNFPNYNDEYFRKFLIVGLTFGILLQPTQLLYFILSIVMLYFRGQNIEFGMHSHWVVIQFSRIYILFNKVSIINFLMGLLQSSTLVMYCISFRIITNYFGIISVFMGTEDNYEKTYFYNLIPHSIVVDVALWTYMIILKTYAPNLTNKFTDSSITNIFKQYPVIEKIEPILKILKIIQLLAYVSIELIVITEAPSIIVFVRLALHLIIAAVDLAHEKVNQTLKNLWKVNLYVSLFIAFLKYFYLLNRYENLSTWLITLLEPLQRNWSIIGLWSTEQTDNIFILLFMFLPDIFIIVLSMIVQYTLQVKIFQSYRQLFLLKDEKNLINEDSSSQQNFKKTQAQVTFKIEALNQNQSQKQQSTQKTEQNKVFIFPSNKQEKNIQYLYKNYIKQVKFKFKHSSIIGRILSDFLYDIYLLLLCFVYFLLEDPNSTSSFWFYIVHFMIAFLILMLQDDRKLPKKTFIYSIIYCCITILFLYLKYLYSYITIESNDQNSYFYKLSDILNKYILFLIGCLFYKLHQALKQQIQLTTLQKSQDRRKNLLFLMIMPSIDKRFTHNFLKQISLVWINFFKSVVLGIYVANCFTSVTVFVFNIVILIYLLLVIKSPHLFGYHNQQVALKHYWVYPFLLSFCFTLWNSQLIGILGIFAVRIYIIFYLQFQLAVDFLFCEYVTQSQRFIVDKIDDKFKRKSIDKLSIIPQQKEGMSKINFSSSDQQTNKGWQYRNLYKTVLLLLPNICIVFLLFSLLFLFKNPFSTILCLLIVLIFFDSIKFIEKKQVFTDGMKKIIFIYFLLILVITFVVYTDEQIDQNKNQTWVRLGIFFLCLGYFFYFYLTQCSDSQGNPFLLISKGFKVTFMQQRCEQALQYWSIKSQFVSQLGCQIHNQKKLLKLQKYYIRKQKISRRVVKLIEQIQQRGRNTFRKNYSAADFQVIDHIMDYNDQGTHYELFSNMLVILSLEDLQFCLQMMNHYYRPCMERKNYILQASRTQKFEQNGQNINQMMAAQMKQIRSNVLSIYHGSIYSAFKQYKRSLQEEIKQRTLYTKSNQNSKMERDLRSDQINYNNNGDISSSSFSEEQEMVNFQKNQVMNQKSLKCIERIHAKSMQVPWLWRKIIQNSEIISLVIVTGWNFFGGVYAIPANFAVFAWALVLQTKTTVFLWSFFFLYAGSITVMKFILPMLPSFVVLDFLFYYYPNSCYYQFLIILVSSFQIFIIKIGGTQYRSYSQRETIYDSFYRKCLNKAAHKIQSPLEAQFVEVYKTLSQPSKHSFIYRVFSKSRLKPGKDFYPLMSGIQLIILLYIFFFYDMMQFQSRNNRKSLGQILTVNQFSKNMMIVLFTQVIIMVLDRCIVSLNLIDIKNQGLQNFLLNFAFSDHIKYRAPQDVTHVGFYDFLLILKYIFHIILLVIINFFVYFYIPSSGFHKSLIPKCQNAICGKSYTYLSLFLLLYLSYFVVSGLQIKHGFNRDKCKNKLMEKYHYVNYYVYVLFTGIPFLWEFKKICDWTITTTALPLFHWMKFEDINARLYQSKCQAQMLKIKPRAKAPWTKYFIGPAGCLFILGLVFSPLLIYSSLNPFAVKDEVLAAEVNFNLLVNGTVLYKFFSTSQAFITQDIQRFPESYRNEFESGKRIQQYIDLEDNNDFFVKMSSYPDQNFKISEPAVEKLSSRIQRAITGKKYRFFDMILQAKIIQKEGGQNEIHWAQKRLNESQLLEFKQFILPRKMPQNSSYQIKTFKIQNFYSPIPGTIQNKTICLFTRNEGQYYELYTADKQSKNCKIDGIQEDQTPGILLFYSSSTKYKIGFGLITFYVTYVLLISRLFRVYLTGNLDNVIYEGCHLERMLILCDAVRQARILENLYQEQYLYSFLVDLMRNPRTLKQMSGDFTNLRENLPLQK